MAELNREKLGLGSLEVSAQRIEPFLCEEGQYELIRDYVSRYPEKVSIIEESLATKLGTWGVPENLDKRYVGFFLDYNHYFDVTEHEKLPLPVSDDRAYLTTKTLETNPWRGKVLAFYEDSRIIFEDKDKSKEYHKRALASRERTYGADDLLFEILRAMRLYLELGENFLTGEPFSKTNNTGPMKESVKIKILTAQKADELSEILETWIAENVNFADGDQVSYEFSASGTFTNGWFSAMVTHITFSEVVPEPELEEWEEEDNPWTDSQGNPISEEEARRLFPGDFEREDGEDLQSAKMF